MYSCTIYRLFISFEMKVKLCLVHKCMYGKGFMAIYFGFQQVKSLEKIISCLFVLNTPPTCSPSLFLASIFFLRKKIAFECVIDSSGNNSLNIDDTINVIFCDLLGKNRGNNYKNTRQYTQTNSKNEKVNYYQG